MIIKSIEELAHEMLECDSGYITYAGFYEDVRDLFVELVRHGMDVDAVCLEPSEYDGYGEEYYLILTEFGVSIERAKYNDTYKADEPDVLFFNVDSNKKILGRVEALTILVDLDNEPVSGCDECPERFDCPDYDGIPFDVSVVADDEGKIHSLKLDKDTDNEKIHFEYKSSLPIDDDTIDYLMSWF